MTYNDYLAGQMAHAQSIQQQLCTPAERALLEAMLSGNEAQQKQLVQRVREERLPSDFRDRFRALLVEQWRAEWNVIRHERGLEAQFRERMKRQILDDHYDKERERWEKENGK